MKNLDDTISSHREAVTVRPPGHPYRSRSLDHLAIALRTRFQQLGQVEDLEEAISFHREALTVCPSAHSDRSRFLNNLAIALRTRFQ